jgi:hypothetical protein
MITTFTFLCTCLYPKSVYIHIFGKTEAPYNQTTINLFSLRFDSSVAPLIFADQFIKISTRLSSPLIYGLGEHRERLLLNVTNNWKRLTFWARDVPPTPNNNLYG